MKLLYFLLKTKQYRKGATFLAVGIGILLISNLYLCHFIASHQEKLIFIPTHSQDPFVFQGGFSANYLAKLSGYLTQSLLSFPNPHTTDNCKMFISPHNQSKILKAIRQVHSQYTDQNIHGSFIPETTTSVSENTVCVTGTLSFFIHNKIIAKQTLSLLLTFEILNSACFLSALSWNPQNSV